MLLKEQNIQADIIVVEEKQYGAALLYFTGPKEHNITLRKLAKSNGWKLNEYGLFDRTSGKLLASAEEKDIYNRLGLAWIAPEKRTEKLN
jgi:DNA polymerase (family 10)